MHIITAKQDCCDSIWSKRNSVKTSLVTISSRIEAPHGEMKLMQPLGTIAYLDRFFCPSLIFLLVLQDKVSVF